jgi:hypothetical protein
MAQLASRERKGPDLSLAQERAELQCI